MSLSVQTDETSKDPIPLMQFAVVLTFVYGFPLGHVTWKQPITVPLNALVVDNREQYLKEILLSWPVTPDPATPLMSLSVQTDATSKDQIPLMQFAVVLTFF